MKKYQTIVVLILFVSFTAQGFAQSNDELILDFNRDFGYGGFGGDIQGRFSLKVVNPTDIVRVEYYLDGNLVFESKEAPFKWQFNTASFPAGKHIISGIGYKADGTQLQTPGFSRTFLSAEQAWKSTGNLVVPILVIVGVATLIGILGPLLLGKKRVHTPGVYSVAGGAVCPRCTFPYSRNTFSPNLVIGKLERCPHCGKWAIVPRATREDLKSAEDRLIGENLAIRGKRETEESLQKLIEESRFDD